MAKYWVAIEDSEEPDPSKFERVEFSLREGPMGFLGTYDVICYESKLEKYDDMPKPVVLVVVRQPDLGEAKIHERCRIR